MIKIIPLAPFFFFFILLSHHASLFLIHSHLISEAHLSQAHSLNSGLSSSLIHHRQPDSSSTSPPPKLNVIDPPTVPSHRLASDPRRHPPQTHVANRSVCSWLCLLVDIRYLTGKPMELVDPPLLPTQLANVVLICDWWFLFCLWLMILFGLDWEKILEIWFFFFSLLWTGGGVGGGCGYGCVCGCGWW